MRKRFSERYGYKTPRDRLQIESMDDGLRNRLWNSFENTYLHGIIADHISNVIKHEREKIFFKKLFDEFFKEKNNTYIQWSIIYRYLETKFVAFRWYQVYDFLEYVSSVYYDDRKNINFRQKANQILEEEMSGYRFIGEFVTPIINDIEIKEIEEAMSSEYDGVNRHLSNALEHLSDRTNPDYITSIKESISAVEATCQILTGSKQDLGACLKQLELDINKQFKTGMTTIYGWTCQEDGIRHAHTKEEIKSSFEEAKYMLVSCSAFVNYLIAKSKIDKNKGV